MVDLSLRGLIAKRLKDDWALLSSVSVGVLAASVLIAATPTYLAALDQQAVMNTLDSEYGQYLNLTIFANHIALSREGLTANADALDQSAADSLADANLSKERYLRTNTYVAGRADTPLPKRRGPASLVTSGYFQHLTNLEPNATFVAGRMASDAVEALEGGFIIEAVVSEPTSDDHGLKVGSEVTLAPSTVHPVRITARIAGIVLPDDPLSEYWRYPQLFLDPAPPLSTEPGVNVRLEPPLALFVTSDVLLNVVGESYDGTLVDPFWFIVAETEELRRWSIAELRGRFADFTERIGDSMPGAEVLAGGLDSSLEELSRKSFFSKIPLLMLLTVMVATVLFYLAMTVAYLVQKREGDLALLKTRGVGTIHMLRLYGLEATLITLVAVIIAPFLAMGAVALAGKLPYFAESTGGSTLPVQLSPDPFLAALGAGALCLAILIVPPLLGARGGLIVHKLRSSRPPDVPFIHRYYIDLALLIIGGLLFWEFQSRGQFVSGGLFKDVQVNETLLIAPVLFLLVVALIFMRLFPLLVRFVSGESSTLVHLVAAAALVALAPLEAARQLDQADSPQAGVAVAILAAVAVFYWAAQRSTKPRSRLVLAILQAAAVAAFIAFSPPDSDELTFLPSLALLAIVPLQVAFLAARLIARTAPVWLSMSLWRMARNPLQYTWLIVLLLLATGLAILSTTVGGSLDKSQQHRILYDIAADVKVTAKSARGGGRMGEFKDAALANVSVDAAALAFRSAAIVNNVSVQLLGVEARAFAPIAWFRDDFAPSSLGRLVQSLTPSPAAPPLPIPNGASTIGVWANPDQSYFEMFLWALLEDSNGSLRTVSLGELGSPGWQLLTGDVPRGMARPLSLVAVQIYEPSGGLLNYGSLTRTDQTSGRVLLDDIHVISGLGGEPEVLEDFEGEDSAGWATIITAAPRRDELTITNEPLNGAASGALSFGAQRNRLLRGIYRSGSGTQVPVVAGGAFLAASGLRVGQSFAAEVEGRLVPFVIRDEATYFPTIDPQSGGFILADLDPLMFHLNLVSGQNPLSPTELFIGARPGAATEVRDSLRLLASGLASVEDRVSLLNEARRDPLAGVGWRATVLTSLGVVVVAAGLGYLTYLLSTARRARSEAGFLKAIGLSGRQMLTWMGIENVAISAFGIALGVLVGLEMSSILVDAVAVTEDGGEVLPPVAMTTDWAVAGVVLGTVVIFVGLALFTLNRRMLRLNLKTIARLES